MINEWPRQTELLKQMQAFPLETKWPESGPRPAVPTPALKQLLRTSNLEQIDTQTNMNRH